MTGSTEAPTDEIPGVLPIMPGPLGADSPSVPPRGRVLPMGRLHAWVDLLADRAAGRRSWPSTIHAALGRPPFRGWGLWWVTVHPHTGRELLHRARVATVTGGGEMLLSACYLSEPWRGPYDDVAVRAETTLPAEAAGLMCAACAEHDPTEEQGTSR